MESPLRANSPLWRRGRMTWLVALLSVALFGSAGISPAVANGDPGTVSGTVTLQNGDDPEGIWVTLTNTSTFEEFPAQTDETGFFVFTDVADGTWRVSILSAPAAYRGYFGANFSLSGSVLSHTENIALELFPTGTGAIELTVTDASSNVAIVGANASFFGDGGAANRSDSTNSLGFVSFTDLPSGVFSISVSDIGYVDQTLQIAVVDGEVTTEQVLLVPANAAVTGRVADVDDNPIANLWVAVQSPTGGPNLAGGSTNTNGVFTFTGLGAGAVEIVAGGVGSGYAEVKQPATLVANETTTVDLVLTPRLSGAAIGTVVDGDGVGIPDICGTAYDVATGDAIAGFLATDPSGFFSLDDLDLGDVTVLFWDCDFTRTPAFATVFLGNAVSLASANDFEVTNGGLVELGEITLERGATISGTVRLQAGDSSIPLPANRGVDAKLYVLDGGTWSEFPDPSPFVGGGVSGEYEVLGVPAGTYRVALGDPATGVKAYTTKYWQDADDFDDANNVVVAGTAPITGIDAIVEVARPGYQPTPISTDSLTPDVAGDVSTNDDTLTQNELVEVGVGEEFAGEWVSVWGHSTPVQMGDWVQVGPTGLVTVPVPTALPPGPHQLAALDAEGALIGWTDVSITPADTPPGSMPATGLNASQAALLGVVAVGLLGLGALLLVSRAWGRARREGVDAT